MSSRGVKATERWPILVLSAAKQALLFLPTTIQVELPLLAVAPTTVYLHIRKVDVYSRSIRKVYVVIFPGFRVGPRVSHIKYCNLYGSDRQTQRYNVIGERERANLVVQLARIFKYIIGERERAN